MKHNLLLALVFSFGLIFQADAAFPVKKIDQSEAVNQEQKMSSDLDHFQTQELQESNLSERQQKRLEKKKERLSKKADKRGISDALLNMLILVALWLFLWPLAGHRWFARKPIIWNIIFILTVGGFGIWAVVDLIMILMGIF